MVTAAIGAGLSLASAIYGGIQSAAANNRARRLIQRQRDENKRWYDTKMAQDYTLRTDAQAAINRQRELLNEQYNRARKTGVVSGATNEAVAMQKEAANKALSDTTSEIASQASTYKDRAEAQYRAQDSALNQQQIQNNQAICPTFTYQPALWAKPKPAQWAIRRHSSSSPPSLGNMPISPGQSMVVMASSMLLLPRDPLTRLLSKVVL